MPEKPSPHTLSTAWKKTISSLRKTYFRWLLGMLISIILRFVAYLPLLALFLYQNTDPMRYIVILTPALFIFILWPMRFSMGETMGEAVYGGHASVFHMLSLRKYLKKLKAVFLHGLVLLPWALPLIVGLCIGVYMMFFLGDGTDVLRTVISIGKAISPKNSLLAGILVTTAVYFCLSLVLAYGAMRNGMFRFIWAQYGGKFKKARKEIHKRLSGRHGSQFMLSFLLFLPTAPFILLCGYTGNQSLMNFVHAMRAEISQIVDIKLLYGVAAAFILFYIPSLPLRRMCQAQFICYLGSKRTKAIAETPLSYDQAYPQTGQVEAFSNSQSIAHNDGQESTRRRAYRHQQHTEF